MELPRPAESICAAPILVRSNVLACEEIPSNAEIDSRGDRDDHLSDSEEPRSSGEEGWLQVLTVIFEKQ
jgi:hypothetical protein